MYWIVKPNTFNNKNNNNPARPHHFRGRYSTRTFYWSGLTSGGLYMGVRRGGGGGGGGGGRWVRTTPPPQNEVTSFNYLLITPLEFILRGQHPPLPPLVESAEPKRTAPPPPPPPPPPPLVESAGGGQHTPPPPAR